MFNGIIDKLAIINFDNKGVAYTFKDKDYLFKNNNLIAIEDNLGNYFWATKDKVNLSQSGLISCTYDATQTYTIKAVSNVSALAYLVKKISFIDTSQDDNVTFKSAILVSINEEKITEKLFLTTIEVELNGTINNCDVELPCVCD